MNEFVNQIENIRLRKSYNYETRRVMSLVYLDTVGRRFYGD